MQLCVRIQVFLRCCMAVLAVQEQVDFYNGTWSLEEVLEGQAQQSIAFRRKMEESSCDNNMSF